MTNEKRPQIRSQSLLLAITSSPSDSGTEGDDELTPTSQLAGEVQIPWSGGLDQHADLRHGVVKDIGWDAFDPFCTSNLPVEALDLVG